MHNEEYSIQYYLIFHGFYQYYSILSNAEFNILLRIVFNIT